MVLNRREIRLSRRVRGESLHAVRVRVAFSDTLSAANFFFQVTCHREVQAGLHHLELLLKKQQPRISIQLCGYLQWMEICRGKFLKRINLFLLTNTYNFHISAWCCGEPRLET
jgi:hypothetical protein